MPSWDETERLLRAIPVDSPVRSIALQALARMGTIEVSEMRPGSVSPERAAKANLEFTIFITQIDNRYSDAGAARLIGAFPSPADRSDRFDRILRDDDYAD